MSLAIAMTAQNRHHRRRFPRPGQRCRAWFDRGVLSFLGGRWAGRRLALVLLLVNGMLLAGQGRAPLTCGWTAGAGLLTAPTQAAPRHEPLLRNPPIQPDTVAALAARESLADGCRGSFRKSAPGVGDPVKAAGAGRIESPAGRRAGQPIDPLRISAGHDFPATCHQSNRPPPAARC